MKETKMLPTVSCNKMHIPLWWSFPTDVPLLLAVKVFWRDLLRRQHIPTSQDGRIVGIMRKTLSHIASISSCITLSHVQELGNDVNLERFDSFHRPELGSYKRAAQGSPSGRPARLPRSLLPYYPWSKIAYICNLENAHCSTQSRDYVIDLRIILNVPKIGTQCNSPPLYTGKSLYSPPLLTKHSLTSHHRWSISYLTWSSIIIYQPIPSTMVTVSPPTSVTQTPQSTLCLPYSHSVEAVPSHRGLATIGSIADWSVEHQGQQRECRFWTTPIATGYAWRQSAVVTCQPPSLHPLDPPTRWSPQQAQGKQLRQRG